MQKSRYPSKQFLYSLLLLCLADLSTAQVQFPVSFAASASSLTSAERSQIESHVRASGALWAQAAQVTAGRSIEVEIAVNDAISTGNGGSVTSSFVTNNGRNMFEQGAAFELITGVDPNAAIVDVRFTFSTNYLRNELWFDPNPILRSDPVPVNRTDAMSVFMHEFGHAFAYNGFNDLNTGIPQPTFWSTFDQWIVPRPTVSARNLFSGPAVVSTFGAQPDLTTGNLFHWANAAAAAKLAHSTHVHSHNHNACGIVSIDQSTMRTMKASLAPNTLIGELMNGVVFTRGTRYLISPLDRAVLSDVGAASLLFTSGFE